MIFAFVCGLKTTAKDYNCLLKTSDPYKTSFHFGYWVRLNILRIKS